MGRTGVAKLRFGPRRTSGASFVKIGLGPPTVLRPSYVQSLLSSLGRDTGKGGRGFWNEGYEDVIVELSTCGQLFSDSYCLLPLARPTAIHDGVQMGS